MKQREVSLQYNVLKVKYHIKDDNMGCPKSVSPLKTNATYSISIIIWSLCVTILFANILAFFIVHHYIHL